MAGILVGTTLAGAVGIILAGVAGIILVGVILTTILDGALTAHGIMDLIILDGAVMVLEAVSLTRGLLFMAHLMATATTDSITKIGFATEIMHILIPEEDTTTELQLQVQEALLEVTLTDTAQELLPIETIPFLEALEATELIILPLEGLLA